MRINSIGTNPSYTGKLIVTSWGNKVEIDTKNITEIKMDREGESCIIFHDNQNTYINMPKDMADTIFGRTLFFNTIISTYNAACQNEDVTIKLPK